MRKWNNNLGQVVGFYSDTSPNVPSPTAHAFLYDNGQWSNLDDPAAVNGTFAEDINDSGVLVGYYVDANRLAHGFVFDRTGTWTTIDYPGATYTYALGMNTRGDVLGSYAFEDNLLHTFVLSADPFGPGGRFKAIDDGPGARRRRRRN